MLTHHGSPETYAEAASAAAAEARERLEAKIERGRAGASLVLDTIARDVPADTLARGSALEWEPRRLATPEREAEAGAFALAVRWNGDAHPLHRNALLQACERGGIPGAYVEGLLGRDAWGAELAAHNLHELLGHTDRRYLLRSVGGEVRGFLSDRFRRLDCRPIVEAFALACQNLGAVPVEGDALATRVAIKALLPRVFEPVPGEVMAFGIQLANSDFGDGALSLRGFVERLWCTNRAVGVEELRQVHLGGQLPDEIAFSDRTYRLDTARSVSMVRDVTTGSLAPARIAEACALVSRANAEKVEPRAVAAFLAKHLNKTEAKAVSDSFASADVENLPPGQTAWRLSNAVSWVAGQVQDRRRALELEQVAGLALAAA